MVGNGHLKFVGGEGMEEGEREEGRGRRKDRGDKEEAKGEVPGGNACKENAHLIGREEVGRK